LHHDVISVAHSVEDNGIKRRLVEGDGSARALHPQLRLNGSHDDSFLSA
jgi:hypothetical protein